MTLNALPVSFCQNQNNVGMKGLTIFVKQTAGSSLNQCSGPVTIIELLLIRELLTERFIDRSLRHVTDVYHCESDAVDSRRDQGSRSHQRPRRQEGAQKSQKETGDHPTLFWLFSLPAPLFVFCNHLL